MTITTASTAIIADDNYFGNCIHFYCNNYYAYYYYFLLVKLLLLCINIITTTCTTITSYEHYRSKSRSP